MTKRKTKKQEGTELLKVVLTKPEKVDLSEEMAKASVAIEDLEAQKKAAAAHYDGEIKSAKAIVSVNARKIRDGFQMQPVKIETVHDWTDKSVTTTRLDTGEIIRSREMTANERQMTLEGTE